MLREALDFPTRGGAKSLLAGGTLLLFAGFALAVAVAVTAPEEAARYRLTTPRIAVALVALAVFLVCRLLVRGYYVTVLGESAASPETNAPSFGSPRSLFLDGVKAEFVAVVYLLPAVALFLVAGGGNLATAIEDPTAAVETARTLASLAMLVGLFYVLGMVYVLPAAVTNFAYTGDVWAAFHVRTVVSGALSEDYAVGWVMATVLQALLLPFAYLLQGIVLGFFLRFFVDVAARHIFGRSFGAAAGFGPREVAHPTVTPPSSPEAPSDEATRVSEGTSGPEEPGEGAAARTDSEAAGPDDRR